MRTILFILFALITHVNLLAQSEYLRIENVRDSWESYSGSIDKITLLVTPKGLYAECQVYLDISVKCTGFTNPSDSLEIQMGFNLPEDAEVIDLWLWINNIPVRAGIYDRWTASTIYEDIVERRQDPALLLKNSDVFYELRIFPMMVNLPRKVKMTFLLPFNKITGKETVLSLPLNILKLSYCPIDSIRIAYKKGTEFSDPKLIELPQNTFTLQNDPDFGEHYSTHLNNSSSISTLNMSLSNQLQSSIFSSYYPVTNSNYGIYQLDIDLAQILGVPKTKKTLFLLDFIKSKSSYTNLQMLETLKNYISNFFESGDSINFMISGLYSYTYSNTWLSADSTSLTQIFNTLDTSYLKNYSNLPSLLMDGINFIKLNNNNGNIVLISSSDYFSQKNDANALLNNMITFMGEPKIPIHSINLNNKSSSSWYGNKYYLGNEYLYANLSTFTGGEFQSIISYNNQNNWWSWYSYNYSTFESLLGSILPKLTDYFTALNVFTTLQAGFTYANYEISSLSGFTYLGSPYRQVGKYTADSFPMNIFISAQTSDGQLYNTKISVDTSEMYLADSVSKNIWAAQNLREMMSFTQSNSVTYQIISTSINERVLTKYTAFLALEPSMPPPTENFNVPTTFGPEEFSQIKNEESRDTSNFHFYPNPMSFTGYFEFTLMKNSNVVIEIYNMQGQKVANVFDKDLQPGKHKITFTAGNLPSGIYFYKAFVGDRMTYSKKIIIMKDDR